MWRAAAKWKRKGTPVCKANGRSIHQRRRPRPKPDKLYCLLGNVKTHFETFALLPRKALPFMTLPSTDWLYTKKRNQDCWYVETESRSSIKRKPQYQSYPMKLGCQHLQLMKSTKLTTRKWQKTPMDEEISVGCMKLKIG